MVKISDIFKLTDSRICVGQNGVFYFFPPSLLCSVLFLFGGKLQNTTTRFLVGTHFSKMFLCFFFVCFFFSAGTVTGLLWGLNHQSPETV